MTTTSTPLRIIVADDQELIREGFTIMFNDSRNIQVVAQAINGQVLLAMIRQYKPDVVVTDIQMPVMTGIEATRMIKKQYPHLPVIAMTMFNDEHNIIHMMQAGALGFISKNVKKEIIADAIYSAYNGENYYCRDTGDKIKALITSGRIDPNTFDSLDFSATETRIITLICEGLESKEIAESLNMSLGTLNRMRIDIYEKADAKSTIDMVMFAIRNGIYKVEAK